MHRPSETAGKSVDGQLRLSVSCYFCGENCFTKLFSATDFDTASEQFDLVECQNCHVVRTEPLLSDDQLGKYYAQSYYGSSARKFNRPIEMMTYYFNYFRARSLLAQMRASQRLSLSSPPRVLDVGCGRATLLKVLDRMGCECHGIERADFPVTEDCQSIRFYRERLEAIHFDSDLFDAVVVWHVLEHLSNPTVALQEIGRVLKPGGVLAVAAPNFDSLQRKLFGAHWFHLDLPRHTHHFSVQTLLDYLRKNGFCILSWNTFSLEQSPYGFVQSCLDTLIPCATPNALYSLLKARGDGTWRPSLIAWLELAFLISPMAVVEYALSGIWGIGAITNVYAERL